MDFLRRWCSQIIVWVFASAIAQDPGSLPQIQVSGGLLEGVLSSDSSYLAYYGIPYATITHRFRESVPDPKWSGVKKANDSTIECLQRVNETSIKGVEDCLILNIYVPNKPSEKLRSVMVYIHEGGFSHSSASPALHGGAHLVKHDVVVVTINYRLDTLGFLCLGIKEAPGNVGLKDQLEALKWVNKNIKAFGGDPDNVTVFGQSAGAASAIYHLMSPLSRNLFNKVIAESGSPISFAFFQYDPIFLAHRLATQLKVDTDDLQELVNNLSNKSATELLLTRVPRKIGDQFETENLFIPCVEKTIPGIKTFLPDSPYNLLTAGKYKKVPMIMGFNNEEGYALAGKENDTTIRNLNFFDSLPRDLDFPSISKKEQTAKEIKALYLPNEPISKQNLVKFSKYAGESSIISPVAITIDKLLATNDQPIFAYKFVHSGVLNVYKQRSGFENYPGATHTDETVYIFDTQYMPAELPQRDWDVIEKLTTLWSNFAKYSNPTPEETEVLPLRWLPVDSEDPQLYVIDNNVTTAPLWNERLHFWKNVYEKYRRPVTTQD